MTSSFHYNITREINLSSRYYFQPYSNVELIDTTTWLGLGIKYWREIKQTKGFGYGSLIQ